MKLLTIILICILTLSNLKQGTELTKKGGFFLSYNCYKKNTELSKNLYYLAERMEDSWMAPIFLWNCQCTKKVWHHPTPMPHPKETPHHQDVKLIHQSSHVLWLDFEPASLPGVGPIHRVWFLDHDSLLSAINRLVQSICTVLTETKILCLKNLICLSIVKSFYQGYQ